LYNLALKCDLGVDIFDDGGGIVSILLIFQIGLFIYLCEGFDWLEIVIRWIWLGELKLGSILIGHPNPKKKKKKVISSTNK